MDKRPNANEVKGITNVVANLAYNCISRFEELFDIRLIVFQVMGSEGNPTVEVIAGKAVTALLHCTSMVRCRLFWHNLIFDTNSGVLLSSKECQVKGIRKSKTSHYGQSFPSNVRKCYAGVYYNHACVTSPKYTPA